MFEEEQAMDKLANFMIKVGVILILLYAFLAVAYGFYVKWNF
jgi:hypothetical protein